MQGGTLWYFTSATGGATLLLSRPQRLSPAIISLEKMSRVVRMPLSFVRKSWKWRELCPGFGRAVERPIVVYREELRWRLLLR